MSRRTCRRPRPTEPPPLKYRDENEAVTPVISSTRSTRIETPTDVGKPRPSGDPALQQLGQSAHADKTKDESTPTDIGNSRSSSLGEEVWRAHRERAKNDLKLSAVVRGKDVQTIWSGTQGSTDLEEIHRLVPNDPLRHNGWWVPPKYISFKQVPRTEYWTCCGTKLSHTRQCPSFDARMRQREADYLQDREDHAARRRHRHAIKIQACKPGETCLLQPSSSKQKHESKSFRDSLSPRLEVCTRRPFLRRKWLDRSNFPMDVEGIPGSLLDSSIASSSGGKRPIIRREHVRSIVQLVLSEARLNVFTVLSALNGLLEVAAAEYGNGVHTTSAECTSNAGFKLSQDDSGGEQQNASISTYLVQRQCTGTTRRLPQGFHVSREYHGESFATSTVDRSDSSSGGESCSGAALCVKLGALPAVIECLNAHAGDRRVEPLGIKLLCVFATDDSAREAIAGNSDVAKICVARIVHFPGKGVDTSGGKITVSRTSGSSLRRRGLPEFVSLENEGTPKAFHGPVSDTTTRSTDTPRKMTVQAATGDMTAAGFNTTTVVATETGDVETPTKKKYIMSPQVAADFAFILSVNLEDSSKCQDLVRVKGIATAMLELVRRTRPDGGDGVRLANSCLRVLELIGMRAKGRRDLVESGCVETVILTFDIFRSHHDILTTAIRLLTLASDSPSGRRRILKAGGVRAVFLAMRRLVGKAVVQVMGTEMLQKITSQEPAARRELDGIKGGWQWLCQGTPEGDSLLRYAPGEKQISGWTVNDEERISTSEALATGDLATAEWTPYKLAASIRTMRDHRELQIDNPACYHFFRVLNEVGLLPHPLEDVYEWGDRVKRYEDEEGVRVSSIARRRLERDRSGGHARSNMSTPSLFMS